MNGVLSGVGTAPSVFFLANSADQLCASIMTIGHKLAGTYNPNAPMSPIQFMAGKENGQMITYSISCFSGVYSIRQFVNGKWTDGGSIPTKGLDGAGAFFDILGAGTGAPEFSEQAIKLIFPENKNKK